MKISKAAIVRATGYFTFGNSIRKDATALVGSLARSRGNSNVCLSRSLERNIALHVLRSFLLVQNGFENFLPTAAL